MIKAKIRLHYFGTGAPVRRLEAPPVPGGEELAVPARSSICGWIWYVYQAPTEGLSERTITEPANCGGKFLRQEKLGAPEWMPRLDW